MTAQELREKYLNFFKEKEHTVIPSASLVPAETDSSVLFTTAGMHPLVPYLLGANHPGGNRVANIQKCVRTGDIDDVGDNRHLTFFEMMGNWSFGDYFKKEAIEWSFEFLTGEKWLNLDPKRIYITVFKGEGSIPKDDFSPGVWQEVFKNKGIQADVAGDDAVIKENIRIIPLGTEDNFWIAGATGPCGPDTEMFYDTRPQEGKLEGNFHDLVNSGRIIEVWNDVFMEFNKTTEGKYEKLSQQNVDTGMGVERTLAVLNGKETVFETELFEPIFEAISKNASKKYSEDPKSFRIIADHIKAATFMIADGVIPSNSKQGYVLRRLIRRAVRYGKLLGIENNFTIGLVEKVIEMYGDFYNELAQRKAVILSELNKEEERFRKTLENGLKVLHQEMKGSDKKNAEKVNLNSLSPDFVPFEITGKWLFDIYQTYGFPLELSLEEIKNFLGRSLDRLEIDEITKEFDEEMQKHQELSRTAAAGLFKGGLQDTDNQSLKYHTSTHLLLAALREILGPETYQKGSNITPERVRFDFNYPEKLTPEQIKLIEDLVNKKIQENIPVEMMEMPKEEALKVSKVSFDPSKYGDIVKVYKIGDFSIELCGGPHVSSTGELGHFKITKEEASSGGVRRIRAILE